MNPAADQWDQRGPENTHQEEGKEEMAMSVRAPRLPATPKPDPGLVTDSDR